MTSHYTGYLLLQTQQLIFVAKATFCDLFYKASHSFFVSSLKTNFEARRKRRFTFHAALVERDDRLTRRKNKTFLISFFFFRTGSHFFTLDKVKTWRFCLFVHLFVCLLVCLTQPSSLSLSCTVGSSSAKAENNEALQGSFKTEIKGYLRMFTN